LSSSKGRKEWFIAYQSGRTPSNPEAAGVDGTDPSGLVKEVFISGGH
jgi:hypothetical protein